MSEKKDKERVDSPLHWSSPQVRGEEVVWAHINSPSNYLPVCWSSRLWVVERALAVVCASLGNLEITKIESALPGSIINTYHKLTDKTNNGCNLLV